MSLDKASPLDVSRATTIVLARQEFTIVPLPFRQVIALSGLLPKFSEIQAKLKAGNLEIGEMLDVLLEIALCGLKRAYPQIEKDDLLDLAMTTEELLAAVPIITQQAGGKAVAAGEAAAASPSAQPIGTDSSPNS